jgi:uncharacterized protein YvpB
MEFTNTGSIRLKIPITELEQYFKNKNNTDVNMKELSKLDVPYYQQTHFATCGPAALMMVMKYWDKSIELSKEFEYSLWRQTRSLIFKGGTFQFGIAETALKRGFKTKIYQKAKISGYKKNWKNVFDFFELFMSMKTRLSRIPVIYGKEIMVVINEALEKKIPPLVFINLGPIIGENIFHWIIVTGLDKENVYVNDPDFSDIPKKDHPVKIEQFKQAIATDTFTSISFPFSIFRFPPAVVLVYK